VPDPNSPREAAEGGQRRVATWRAPHAWPIARDAALAPRPARLPSPCHAARRGRRPAAPAAPGAASLYAGGDEAPVRALLTDDIHWHVPGHNAIAGDYQGIDAVLAYFRRRRDLVDRTFRLHPGDVLVGDGDRIAALTDGTAVVGDVQRRWSTVGLYQVRDGRVVGCWLLPWTRQASTTSGRARTSKPADLKERRRQSPGRAARSVASGQASGVPTLGPSCETPVVST
jgi:ketosteroid isomerase-like protein